MHTHLRGRFLQPEKKENRRITPAPWLAKLLSPAIVGEFYYFVVLIRNEAPGLFPIVFTQQTERIHISIAKGMPAAVIHKDRPALALTALKGTSETRLYLARGGNQLAAKRTLQKVVIDSTVNHLFHFTTQYYNSFLRSIFQFHCHKIPVVVYRCFCLV